jgi:hypothetical protein
MVGKGERCDERSEGKDENMRLLSAASAKDASAYGPLHDEKKLVPPMLGSQRISLYPLVYTTCGWAWLW